MDFLFQAGRQWIAQWQNAPAVSRWTLGIVLALGGIALAVAMSWPRAEQREVLFDGVELSRSDLTAMETAFGKSQLNDARVVGRTIEVPSRTKHLYLKALHDHQALPATFFSYSQRSLASDSPFTSPRQRDALTKLAKEQEVALVLRKIAGIDEASVQFEDVDLGGFPRRKQRQATAAVRATDDRPLEPHVVNAIRATLMNTLGIAEAKAVTVLDLNRGIAYTGGEKPKDESDAAAAESEVRLARHETTSPIDFHISASPPASAIPTPAPFPRATRRDREIPTPTVESTPSPDAVGADGRQGTSDEELPTAPHDTTSAASSLGAVFQRVRDLFSSHETANGGETWSIGRGVSHWLGDNSVTLAVASFGVAAMAVLARRLRRTRERVRSARCVLRSTKKRPEYTRENAGHTTSDSVATDVETDPRQQLQEQIHDDVGSAAATLRQWLSNAA